MTNTKTMDFETMPFKTGSLKAMKNKVGDNLLDKIGTSQIIWYLIKRHKFSIVAMWAVVITITWAFPPFWDILGSLIG